MELQLKICQYIPKICPRYAQDISKICFRYIQDMAKICSRYAQDMQKIYPRYVEDMPKTCPRYAKDMQTICPRYDTRKHSLTDSPMLGHLKLLRPKIGTEKKTNKTNVSATSGRFSNCEEEPLRQQAIKYILDIS